MEEREKILNRKLAMMDNLKGKLERKPYTLNRTEIHEVIEEQKKLEKDYHRKVKKQLEPIFAHRYSLL